MKYASTEAVVPFVNVISPPFSNDCFVMYELSAPMMNKVIPHTIHV